MYREIGYCNDRMVAATLFGNSKFHRIACRFMLIILIEIALLVVSHSLSAAENRGVVAEVERSDVATTQTFAYVEYVLKKHDESLLAFGWNGDVWAAGTTEMPAKAGTYHIRVMRALNHQRWSAMDLVTWKSGSSKGHSGAQATMGHLKNNLTNKKKGIEFVWHIVKNEEVAKQKRVRLFTILLPDGSKGDFWIQVQ